MKKRTLKVGFDLDGVLLYNPARIVRPIIAFMKKKKVIIHRDQLEFYVPEPGLGQFFWELLHKSSMWLAPGFEQIEEVGILFNYVWVDSYNYGGSEINFFKK